MYALKRWVVGWFHLFDAAVWVLSLGFLRPTTGLFVRVYWGVDEW